MKLENNEEIVGVLNHVYEEDGELVAVFQMQYQIVLPNDLKLRNQLKKLIGKNVGILRTDHTHKPFLLRDADKTTKLKTRMGPSGDERHGVTR